jgi:hypothetical protein
MKQFILTTIIALATLPLFADIGVRLGTVTGMQGDTIEAGLYVDGLLTGQNVFSFQFQIAYNQSRVELIEVTNSSMLSAAPNSVWNINATGSTYNVTVTNAFGSAMTGSGELVRMKFRLLTSGYTDLTFNGTATNNFFNEGKPAMTFTNGRINVTALPTITVSVPSNTSPMAVGTTVNLSASGGTAPYTWKVTDNAIATVNASGQLTATGIGTVSAWATDSKGYSGTSAAIEIRGYRLTINDTAYYQNQYVEIPVSFQNLANKPVFSGEFSVEYNPSILNFDSIIVENQLIGGNGNSFNSNVSAPSASVQRLRVGFANSAGFTASGVLAKIRFRIANATSGSTSMSFTSVQFNNDEQAIVRNATFRINALPALTITPNAATFQNYAGETRQLTVSGGTAPYTWTSTKPLVASVDGNGLVTVYKGGETTIRVSDVWGAYKTVTFQTFDTKIKVADTLGLVVHRTFRLPIKITLPVAKERNFTAVQGKIVCNAPQIANISIATDNSLAENFATAQNISANGCTFALSGTQAITQAGVLFYAVVEFNETLRQGDSFNITLSDIILNEGSPNAVIEGGKLTVDVQQGIMADLDGSGNATGGTISVDLETVSEMTFTGTMKVTMPAGFTLDLENTLFNPNLNGLISLVITDLGNNTWLFTFSLKAPKGTIAKSSSQLTAALEPYTNLVNLAYRIDTSVPFGAYQVLIRDIQLIFEDSSELNEPEISITVSKDMTGIPAINENVLKAYIRDGMLYVSGLSVGKPLSVYSISGALIHCRIANKEDAEIPLPVRNVYIVVSGKNAVKVN